MSVSSQVIRSVGTVLLCSALAAGNSFAGGHAKVKAMIKGSDGQNHGLVEFYGVPGGVLMDAQLQGLPPSTRFISTRKARVPLTSKPEVILTRRVSNMDLVLAGTQVRIRTFTYQTTARSG